jgi:hypothetical protein
MCVYIAKRTTSLLVEDLTFLRLEAIYTKAATILYIYEWVSSSIGYVILYCIYMKWTYVNQRMAVTTTEMMNYDII